MFTHNLTPKSIAISLKLEPRPFESLSANGAAQVIPIAPAVTESPYDEMQIEMTVVDKKLEQFAVRYILCYNYMQLMTQGQSIAYETPVRSSKSVHHPYILTS